MSRNPRPRLSSWLRGAAIGLLGAISAAGAEEVPDERESPALRKPLPALAAPAAEADEPPAFDPEAPPPPPFDPNYRPPFSPAAAENRTSP